MIRVESFLWGSRDFDSQNILGWNINQPNSAGGVSVRGTVANYGQKAVKKYSVYFRAYNGADEVVECTASGKSIMGVSSADRVESGGSQEFFAENLWYNYSIRRVEIDHIDVVYADNTTESCRGNHILTPEEQKIQQEVIKKSRKFLKGCLKYYVILVVIAIILLILLGKFIESFLQ